MVTKICPTKISLDKFLSVRAAGSILSLKRFYQDFLHMAVIPKTRNIYGCNSILDLLSLLIMFLWLQDNEHFWVIDPLTQIRVKIFIRIQNSGLLSFCFSYRDIEIRLTNNNHTNFQNSTTPYRLNRCKWKCANRLSIDNFWYCNF